MTLRKCSKSSGVEDELLKENHLSVSPAAGNAGTRRYWLRIYLYLHPMRAREHYRTSLSSGRGRSCNDPEAMKAMNVLRGQALTVHRSACAKYLQSCVPHVLCADLKILSKRLVPFAQQTARLKAFICDVTMRRRSCEAVSSTSTPIFSTLNSCGQLCRYHHDAAFGTTPQSF